MCSLSCCERNRSLNINPARETETDLYFKYFTLARKCVRLQQCSSSQNTGWVNLDGTSGDGPAPAPAPAQAGSTAASCPGPCPAGFWISPQPAWATPSSAQSPSRLKRFSQVYSIPCFSVSACCFLSCHWAPLRRVQLFLLYLPTRYSYTRTFSVLNSPRSLATFLTQMLQFLHHLDEHLLDSLLWVHVCLVLRSPWLHPALQPWPQQCWVEGKDHLPLPNAGSP